MDNNKKKLVIDGKNLGRLKLNQRKTIENINRISDEKGITKYRLAQEAHISHSHFYNIVSGRKSISLDHVKKIAECLEVAVSEIVAYENDYDEGYSDAISSLVDFFQKDSLGLKPFVYNFNNSEGNLKYSSFLYPFMYSMGYEVYVIDSKELRDKYTIPIPDNPCDDYYARLCMIYSGICESYFNEEKVYLVTKDGKGVFYCSPDRMKRIEKQMKSKLEAYFANIEEEMFYILSAPDYDDTDSEGVINNGTFTINSYNDGIQVKSKLIINDGDFYIKTYNNGASSSSFD